MFTSFETTDRSSSSFASLQGDSSHCSAIGQFSRPILTNAKLLEGSCCTKFELLQQKLACIRGIECAHAKSVLGRRPMAVRNALRFFAYLGRVITACPARPLIALPSNLPSNISCIGGQAALRHVLPSNILRRRARRPNVGR